MDWLKSLAPLIGTALGGPLGGMAASMVADKLGLPESTVEAVTCALKGNSLTSEQIASLKLAEMEMSKFLADNNIKLEEIAQSNTADARAMAAKTGDTNTPRWLAVFAVVCFIGLIVAVMKGATPAEGMKDTFLILVGAAIAVFKDVYGYYFGSSSGSRENQAAMRDQIAR